MDRRADALDLVGPRGSTQASTASAPVVAVRDHLGGEPPLRLGDRIERAVERQPVEIIGDRDVARGARMRSRPKNAPAAK